MISQVIIPDAMAIKAREVEIHRDMNKLYEKKELDLLVVCFTSVMDDGSIFYAEGEQAEKILNVYPDRPGETHSLQVGVFSRKKQIVPSVMDALS